MRLITLFFLFILSTTLGFSQYDLPVTFDDGSIDYDLTDFGGNNSSVVVDPTDPMNMVGQAIKTASAELWAGTTMGENGFISPIPFANNATQMQVRVWSPDAGTPIRLKVEDSTDPTISVETEVNTTVAMAWETLVFDFSNEAPGTAQLNLANTYNKASIFFNFGTDGATAGEKTYYWDDVVFLSSGLAQVDLPVTFEDSNVDYDLTDFGGNASSVVTDPTDPNNTVGQAIKTDVAELWAGTTMGDNGFASAIPFTADETQISVRVWSPDAGTPIRLKVEDSNDPGISVETEVNTTVAMAWDTLIFDFSNEVDGTAQLNLANTYNKASIFFNFGTDGATAGEKTYYWDDVEFVPGSGSGGGGGGASPYCETEVKHLGIPAEDASAIFLTIENQDASTLFVEIESANGDPVDFLLVTGGSGAMISGEDTSVPGKISRTLSWATPPADVTMNILWSKVSFGGNWQLSPMDITVQFADTCGAVSLDPVDLPITFEDANVDYNLTDFGGNASSIVTDPTDPMNTVGQAIKTDVAEVWAGTTMGDSGLANPIPFANGATQISVRVWSPDVDTPIRLKVEDSNNPTISVETEVNTTTAMAWDTLIFDFANQVDGTAEINFDNTYDKISIFFNFGTDGATAGEKTYYWDDVEFLAPTSVQIDLPVTFEDSNIDYDLTDFGGNASSIVVDPTNPMNTVGQAIKTDVAEVWAGTTMGNNGFANAIPFTADETEISVRVWSPDAGTPIRLKVEDSNDPAISVETEVNTTVAMAWETLTFDFSNEADGTAALNLANTYNKASIFFNFGTDGATAGEKTYYWDDVEFVPGGGSGGGGESPYCETEVTHLGIPAEEASAIFLTITNQDATTMFVEIESANADPVDFLLIAGGSGAMISDEDFSVPGKISRTMTWATPPADVMMNVLWSKESTMGNWQLSPMDITVQFADTCAAPALDPVDLPITFEDSNVDYDLTDFGGNASSIVTDPTDPMNTVGQAIKTASAELWAGTTMGNNGLANPIPFSVNSAEIRVRVWSPDADTPIRIKVEDSADPAISVETEVNTTVAMAWDTLVFDFNNQVDGTAPINFNNTYDKISIFFNFGTDGATAGEKTYFWDDVEFIAPTSFQIDLPVTFEDPTVDYNLTDFGGNASSIVTDPTDPMNTVAQSIKTDAAELWAGTTMGDLGFANPVPFTPLETKMRVRVWSPDADTPVRLKVEDSNDPAISVETEVNTTVAMAWDTLTFDFLNHVDGTAPLNFANTYGKASIFFNFGTDGATAGEKTYFWDDVEFIADAGGQSAYCETEVKHLGIPAEEASAIFLTIKNIDPNTVLVEIESANTDPVDFLLITGGSGATISDEDFSVPGKISRTMTWATPPTDMTMNVLWSKESTMGNWQLSPMDITLPFAATCPPPALDPPSLPITFEETDIDYALTDFGGNASSIVVDPTDPMNTVVEAIKTNTAETFAGTSVANNGLAEPIPFATNATEMTVRVWSPDAGIPVRLKVEDNTNSAISVETEVNTTVAMAWDTLTFDFSAPVAGTPLLNLANTYDKVTIFFNFGTDGATAGEKTYYFDDVDFINPNTFPVDLPITFEADTIDYDLTDFGGNVSSIVVDPTDPNNKVGQAIKINTAETFAGTTMGGNGLANPIPFVGNATEIRVRVWSPDAGTPIRLKAEDAADPAISVETELMTTVGMDWDTLVFDFSNQVDGTPILNLANTYNKLTIFFNFGTSGAAAGEKTYYWDDVEFVIPTLDQIDLPITFEDDNVDYDLTDFGGNASSIVEDPTDPMNTVGQAIKTDVAQTFAGTTMGATGLANAIAFEPNATQIRVRVWSPDANTPIRLKVEDSTDPAISVETEVNTSVGMEWDTLVFNFLNEVAGTPAINFANTYDKITIFFNFGTDGPTAGEKTYYWDDVEFLGVSQVQIDLPVTFEDDNVNYDLTDFGGNASSIVEDPTDPMNTVAESVKTDVAETFAGTTMGNDGFSNPIPFTALETVISVRVWSPDANIPVRLKVENANDPGISVETEVNTTVAMEWETLFFDFSNEVAGTPALDLGSVYSKASIFFNFGTDGATAGEKTYYWDDVQFVPFVFDQIDLPVTFEETTVFYELVDFGGNASLVVEDPTDPANTVAQSIKTSAAQTFAGTTMGTDGFANAIPFTADETKMTVRVWSPDANTPIRLKVEDAADPGISVETEVNTTVAMEWETLEFDFSNEVPGTPALNLANTYDKAIIFFNFGTDGPTAGEKTYFWDDVEFGGLPLPNTVYDIIANSTAHDTLEIAIDAAELDDDLMSAGPFTVFAPTDDAFANLPAGLLDALLADPTGALADVLLYHVLGIEALSGGLSDGQMVTTLLGFDLTINIDGNDNVFINNEAQVIVADLQAQNGVVHVIDAVLSLPDATNEVSINAPALSVYPNPADQQVTLSLDKLGNAPIQLEIFHTNGQLAYSQMINSTQVVVPTANFDNGVYLIKLKGEEWTTLKRLVIQR